MTERGDPLRKRQPTPAYIFFYILFLPDTWQILIGLAAAAFLAPALRPQEMGAAGGAVLFLMVAAIGYAASGPVGRAVSRFLRRRIPGNRQP